MFLHIQNAIHVTLYIIRRAFISSSLKKTMYTKISSVHGSSVLTLKWMANSQVLLFFSMFNLWLRNLTLNSVEVEPTYCRLHLAQVAK